METPAERVLVTDFYTDVVLPELADRLDQAFPEFGWKRDRLGWVATNQEMTHRVLGVRADRVIAHGPAPRGFLVHGGDATLWTAYLNGGNVPRGEQFIATVRDLAARAGVDTTPIDQAPRRDRSADVLHAFFGLCQHQLISNAGTPARRYLESRGLPADTIDHAGLGLVPTELTTKKTLTDRGYSELEIAQSGVVADGRWPGRLCGAWTDDRHTIRTLWARTLTDSDTTSRYLYLKGHSRTHLPPYGLADALRLPAQERRDLILVEGLLDVHHLRACGIANIAAAGSARINSALAAHLTRRGIDTLTLAFDNDPAGRDGTSRAIDTISRARTAPSLKVLEPSLLNGHKDPDAYVRAHGPESFRQLLSGAGCAIAWNALELTHEVTPADEPERRREALARAGSWLGSLPRRHALEQEDAIHAVAERCGYSPEAVQRAFHARFWQPRQRERVAFER